MTDMDAIDYNFKHSYHLINSLSLFLSPLPLSILVMIRSLLAPALNPYFTFLYSFIALVRLFASLYSRSIVHNILSMLPILLHVHQSI